MDLDHFSAIPGELRANILSRLPPRDAVRTSVLARGWRRSWNHSLWNFYFNDQTYTTPVLLYDHDTNRLNLFHSILPMIADLFRESGNKKILKMELILNSCLTQRMNSILLVNVCTVMAIGPNLVHLYLNLDFQDNIVFPLEDLDLSSCVNLETLRLSNAINVELAQPDELELPSLRTLEMNRIYCHVFILNQFLACCFNCKTLHLNIFTDDVATLFPPRLLEELTVIVNQEPIEIDEANLGAPLELGDVEIVDDGFL